jgi:hypothetical protein
MAKNESEQILHAKSYKTQGKCKENSSSGQRQKHQRVPHEGKREQCESQRKEKEGKCMDESRDPNSSEEYKELLTDHDQQLQACFVYA